MLFAWEAEPLDRYKKKAGASFISKRRERKREIEKRKGNFDSILTLALYRRIFRGGVFLAQKFDKLYVRDADDRLYSYECHCFLYSLQLFCVYAS